MDDIKIINDGDDDQCSGMENQDLLSCAFLTANVGTIFEDSSLLDLWFEQLRNYLTKVKRQFVAIHCQEVGGKHYESSMKNVSNFTDKIIADLSTVDYTRVRIFLDEDFESLEKFTALGSLYLIHKSVKNIKLFNFKTAQYEPVEGIKVYAGNSINEAAEHVEKIKFPQELFPECRWSRKGFMRTRWLLNEAKPLDLVNIHLFHDACNLVAMEKTPSPYAQYRQQALEFTLQSLAQPLKDDLTFNISSEDQNSTNIKQQQQRKQVPLFIFGDFNFRLDTNKVIQKITDGVPPVIKRKADSNEVVEFVYHKRKDDTTISNLVDNNNKNNNTISTNTNQDNVSDGMKTTINCNNIKNVNLKDDGNSNYIENIQHDNDGETNTTIATTTTTSKGGGGVVMTVGKKIFDCENLDETFRATKNTSWLLELDNELDKFKDELYEFKISFNPSYPFKEDTSGGYSYMKTRCPAWCDRILFNAAGSKLIHCKSDPKNDEIDDDANNKNVVNQSIIDSEKKKIELLQSQNDIYYCMLGEKPEVPMGDHKPVLLQCRLSIS